MDREEFRRYGHDVVEWMADYLEDIEDYPVMSQVDPGDVKEGLQASPPQESQEMEEILSDFEDVIIPGVTHWQHPSFFAYFPANSSPPSVLAEMLTAALGVQGMIWQTSPAATELEEHMMAWLREMLGLPSCFEGVIQDGASTSTLCSILSAREKASDYRINKEGMSDMGAMTTYCSTETHSSIEKGVKIAGLGKENLRKVPVDEDYAMIPGELERSIENDLSEGHQPVCVVATLGTTGSTAIDPLDEIADICDEHDIWLHVDAALAGTVLILPEYRWMIEGIEKVDSFVFNPHKWMFTNFDCSAYFVRDARDLIRTFQITPEYLRTDKDRKVNNYRDWGIQLGRRFRALKLWFVIRSYGVKGLQKLVRKHINLAKEIRERIGRAPDFELMAPVPLNTICFRYNPRSLEDEKTLNEINEELLSRLNNSGKLYMTHTTLDGRYTIRFVVGQTYVESDHVEKAWDLIQRNARSILEEPGT